MAKFKSELPNDLIKVFEDLETNCEDIFGEMCKAGHIVTKEFRKKYSADTVEAIVNNYLDDPTNEKYIAELKEMQEYRKQCKASAKVKMEIV